MTWKRSKLSFLNHLSDLGPKPRMGISLHAHTEHSREMLDFIPFYAEKIPIVAYLWQREKARFLAERGREIDFSNAYWSPPMTPDMVYKSECDQIRSIGLDPLVSITDHDSISGSLDVTLANQAAPAPISLEWTVPFGIGFFHVGVHNLPPESAREIAKILLGYTIAPDADGDSALMDILTMLYREDGVLVVLNHPLWDIELVGKERHEVLLAEFLDQYGHRLHALEINGFRSWSENKAVVDLAKCMDLPVVSGGDRHGCQPNTVINVSEAETFGEFAEDIRIGKGSHIAILPEYRQPLLSRQLASASEILGKYPSFPESRVRWFDRIFFDLCDGGGTRPLSELGWVRGPLWLRYTIRTFRLLGSKPVRPLFRFLEKPDDEVPRVLNAAEDSKEGTKNEPKLSSI